MVYCGTLRTHKKRTISIRGKAVKLPESEHFVFENHHEPMISMETFKSANEIRNKKSSTNPQNGKPKRNYFFGGFCRCAECGRAASGMAMARKNFQKAYQCNDYKKYGSKRCKIHEILEEDMWFQFKDFLKTTKKEYLDEIKKIRIENKKNQGQSNKKRLQNELEQVNLEYKMLLNQKIKDLALM